MNFIDIASWQHGIDLATLFAENPLDGVIVKATEGTGYINPDFKGWADWLIANGKHLGLYHYCFGADAKSEAQFYYNAIKPYIGKAVPCADYEGSALNRGAGWLKTFLDEFLRLSNVKCLIYCSQSVTQSQNFNAIAAAGYRLWMAQYADYSPVYGFKSDPWHKGSVSPFVGYQMHQYTSCGVLNGWRGYLDFDLFYGTRGDWDALCGDTPVVLKDADPVVVSDVLAGKYGVNEERAEKLTEAGYNFISVQNKINELYGIASKCRKDIGNNMDYINSIVYITKL